VDDRYDLKRFVDAQQGTYLRAIAELRGGRKRSHWIWFIFPQIEGLGQSPTSQRFAISSPDEARAYFDHPMLGPRLLECTRLVNLIEGRSANEIFGYPDDLKFRSSMTLFAESIPQEPLFRYALQKYSNGEPDRLTLERLGSAKA